MSETTALDQDPVSPTPARASRPPSAPPTGRDSSHRPFWAASVPDPGRSPPRTRARAAVVAAVLAVAAAGWVCPVHALTGWDCPGCGARRALLALLHGDAAEAVGHNALVVLAAPALTVLGGVRWRRGRPGPLRWRGTWSVRAASIVVGAFTVARNVPVPALRGLAA